MRGTLRNITWAPMAGPSDFGFWILDFGFAPSAGGPAAASFELCAMSSRTGDQPACFLNSPQRQDCRRFPFSLRTMPSHWLGAVILRGRGRLEARDTKAAGGGFGVSCFFIFAPASLEGKGASLVMVLAVGPVEVGLVAQGQGPDQ